MPQQNRDAAGVLSKPIRDLYAAIKALQAGIITGPLTVTGTVSVTEPVSVDDNGSSLTVDAVNLDIRDLSSASDSVTVVGTVTSAPTASATATHSNVTGTGSSVTLLAANASRKGYSLWNDSAVAAVVKLASGASATSGAFPLRAGAYYESPAGFNYTGIITGIWASGDIRVVEFT